MGTVYLARDLALGRQVAIKLLPTDLQWAPEARARFLREARVMATLDHPHIVRILTLGQTGGHPYLVMEYIGGESLARRIWRHPKGMPLDDALRITEECAEALAAAWKHGIVHRDVKPSNVLLDPDAGVHVADFGLAKPVREADEITLPDQAIVMCTPQYVSPEQAFGEDALDFRSDVFSLGIVLFELLTGHRPFAGSHALAALVRGASEPLPDVRTIRGDLPEPVAGLLEWMTRKRPEQRPSSYARLIERIRQLRGDRSSIQEEVAWGAILPLARLDDDERAEEAAPPVFVGRQSELATLEGWLSAALRGEGRVVFVTGEAGTGKSSLLRAFIQRATRVDDDLVVAPVRSYCSPAGGDEYGPFRRLLGLFAGAHLSDSALGLSDEHRRRLWRCFPETVRTLTEECPDLLSTLVDAEQLTRRARRVVSPGADWVERLQTAAERLAARGGGPSAARAALHEQYARLLGALERRSPLLLVLDDVHWADSPSLALLPTLGAAVEGRRILLVGAYRSSEIAPDAARPERSPEPIFHELARRFGENELSLDGAGDREFIDALVDSEPNRLDDSFRETLLDRTAGHALFTVEMLRAMEELGMLVRDPQGRWIPGAELDWTLLPAKMEAVVRGRLARLGGAERSLLEVASVEGESFCAEVLATAVGARPVEVVRALGDELSRKARLVAFEGIDRIGEATRSRYRFSHAVFRSFLYDRLDPAQRTHLHDAVGRAMETVYAGRTDECAAALSQHFEIAGRTGRAIRYAVEAGRRAEQLASNEEAVAHFERALALLPGLRAGRERDRDELAILLAATGPAISARGWAEARVRQALQRGVELAGALDDQGALADFLVLVTATSLMAGDAGGALRAGAAAVLSARQSADASRILQASGVYGMSRFLVGDFTGARELLVDALRMRPPGPGTPRRASALYDGVGLCLWWLGHAMRVLGFFDQADRLNREAVARTRDLGLPLSEGAARMHWSVSLLDLGYVEDAEENYRATERLVAERGITWLGWWLDSYHGWLEFRRGNLDRALEEQERGLRRALDSGTSGFFTVNARTLAETCREARRIEPGLQLVAEALAFGARTGERVVEADLLRIRGDLLSARGGDGDAGLAAASYRQALEVARRQQAMMMELRAAIGLGRLLAAEGRPREAAEQLGRVYDGFSEGFEARDLKQARELLDAWGVPA